MRIEVVKWASIEPKIGEISLKPYLFVINDRKNYLSSAAPLSPKLMAILEKLTGGETNAKTCVQELKNLLPTEIDLLFKNLLSKLVSSNSFASKPAAMFGISELVKAHPAALQMRYVEALEGLPVEKIGVWAATGHDSLIIDAEPKARLEKLKSTWHSQTESQAFKTALSTHNIKSRRS